jgi:hypothetical protein
VSREVLPAPAVKISARGKYTDKIPLAAQVHAITTCNQHYQSTLHLFHNTTSIQEHNILATSV